MCVCARTAANKIGVLRCVYVCICTFQSAVVRLTKQHQEVGTELSNSFRSPSNDNKTLSVVRSIVSLIFSAFLFTANTSLSPYLRTLHQENTAPKCKQTVQSSVKEHFLKSQVYPHICVVLFIRKIRHPNASRPFSLLSRNIWALPLNPTRLSAVLVRPKIR